LRHAKAQAASLDAVIAVAAILFFIAIIIVFFPSKPKDAGVYNNKAFIGIENADPANRFLSGYVVDETALLSFSSLPENRMESIVLNSTEFIGYTSDICIFFADSTGILQINGMNAVGQVYLDSSKTIKGVCDPSNPCKHYRTSSVYTRPVARLDTITNLHVVVCT